MTLQMFRTNYAKSLQNNSYGQFNNFKSWKHYKQFSPSAAMFIKGCLLHMRQVRMGGLRPVYSFLSRPLRKTYLWICCHPRFMERIRTHTVDVFSVSYQMRFRLVWKQSKMMYHIVQQLAAFPHRLLVHWWKTNDNCHSDICQTSEWMLAELGFKLTTPWLDEV